jgi:hypothetical protein
MTKAASFGAPLFYEALHRLARQAMAALNRRRGRLAQLVRASRLHREGREFESLAAYQPSPCGLRLGKPEPERQRSTARVQHAIGVAMKPVIF